MKNLMRNLLVCMSMIMLMAAASLSAQDLTRQKNKKAQLEKEISLLDKQIAGIKAQSSNATARLGMLRQNISNRKELVAESDRIIKSFSDSIKIKDREIAVLQEEVDTLIYYYGRLVRSAYKYRDPHVWYLYVFASDNLGQAFRRAAYFRNISSQIRSDADVIRDKQSDLEKQRQILNELKTEAVSVKEARVKELNDLRKDEKEADNLVQQLKKDRKKIEGQMAAKKKEVKA